MFHLCKDVGMLRSYGEAFLQMISADNHDGDSKNSACKRRDDEGHHAHGMIPQFCEHLKLFLYRGI
jgi:hypothetical protein